MAFHLRPSRPRPDDTNEADDPRRAFLVRALTLGLLAGGGSLAWPRGLLARDGRPAPLPPGRSIHRLRGEIRVNGVPANRDTRIGPTDDIETGSNSELVFVVGKDAFMLRENSALQLSPSAAAFSAGLHAVADTLEGTLIGALRVVSGRLLSVFGERDELDALTIHTPIATIGVRGTGVYLESERDRSYVCTCYGATELAAVDDPASRERVITEYHDSPRYILGEGASGSRIEPAPVINHTDMELVLLESLVGRTPPFGTAGGGVY